MIDVSEVLPSRHRDERLVWFALLERGRLERDPDLIRQARAELERLGVLVEYLNLCREGRGRSAIPNVHA